MLVHIVNSANRSAYAHYLPTMFQQRYELFCERLGCKDMTVVDGQERDEIDDLHDIEYLLAIDDSGALVGSCRFTPLLGPHLMAGILNHLVERPYERAPNMWEWTRYAPAPSLSSPEAMAARAFLLTAVQEWALARGVTRLLNVAGEFHIAFTSRMGWKSRPLGAPKTTTDISMTGVEFEISAQCLADTRRFWKLRRPVSYQAPPPVSPDPITREEIKLLDAVFGLDEEERAVLLRRLARLSKTEAQAELVLSN